MSTTKKSKSVSGKKLSKNEAKAIVGGKSVKDMKTKLTYAKNRVE
jgi:hypothetical protein